MQLELWGLEYFDLFLVHFPVALAYVDPKHRYPPEWWGDDKKSVNLRMKQVSAFLRAMLICDIRENPIPGDVDCHGRAGRRRTSKEYRRQVSFRLSSRHSLTRSYQATLGEAYLSTCSAMPALSPKCYRLNSTHT